MQYNWEIDDSEGWELDDSYEAEWYKEEYDEDQ